MVLVKTVVFHTLGTLMAYPGSTPLQRNLLPDQRLFHLSAPVSLPVGRETSLASPSAAMGRCCGCSRRIAGIQRRQHDCSPVQSHCRTPIHRRSSFGSDRKPMMHPPVTIPIAAVHGMLSGIRARDVATPVWIGAPLEEAGIAPALVEGAGSRVTAEQYDAAHGNRAGGAVRRMAAGAWLWPLRRFHGRGDRPVRARPVRDNTHVDTPGTFASGGHLSADLVDGSIRMLADHQADAPYATRFGAATAQRWRSTLEQARGTAAPPRRANSAAAGTRRLRHWQRGNGAPVAGGRIGQPAATPACRARTVPARGKSRCAPVSARSVAAPGHAPGPTAIAAPAACHVPDLPTWKIGTRPADPPVCS